MRPDRTSEWNKKYQCSLDDERIEEMAKKSGKDPYEMAKMFGGPTPRVVRKYSQSDLLNSLIEARQWKDAADRLKNHSKSKADAMVKAFGIDKDKIPRLFYSMIDRMANIFSPFGVYLCGGPDAFEQRMRDLNGGKIHNAMNALKDALRVGASDVLGAVFYEYDIRETVDSDDLLDAGFDDDIIPPDPDDFW